MCRGFGATERAILRVPHPAQQDGPYVSLRTVTHRLYGHAEPGAVESVRRSLHRLAKLGRVELEHGTVEAEGWQRRLVVRLVPWGFFAPAGRQPDFAASLPYDRPPDSLTLSTGPGPRARSA